MFLSFNQMWIRTKRTANGNLCICKPERWKHPGHYSGRDFTSVWSGVWCQRRYGPHLGQYVQWTESLGSETRAFWMLHWSVAFSLLLRAHRFASSPPPSITSHCEHVAKQQECDRGGSEPLLDRRPALLPTSPLGPAQPRQRGRAEAGGAAAAQHFVPPHGQRLAGLAQVIHTDILDIQPMVRFRANESASRSEEDGSGWRPVPSPAFFPCSQQTTIWILQTCTSKSCWMLRDRRSAMQSMEALLTVLHEAAPCGPLRAQNTNVTCLPTYWLRWQRQMLPCTA